MSEARNYTIHKSKKSQTDRFLDARESLRKTLEDTTFRLETVRELNGIEFINDARSTDLLSTRDSFKCVLKPIVWLASATPHDRDYALIEKYVKYKIKSIVVYGGNGDDMKNKLGGFVEKFSAARDLREAVSLAFQMSTAGDVVVFSPSCTPTDAYRNFADRGGAFKKYIEDLI